MFRLLTTALALGVSTCAIADDFADTASFSSVANTATVEYLGSGRPDLQNRGNRNYIVIIAGEDFSSSRNESNGLFSRQALDSPIDLHQAYALSYTRTWIDDTGYSLASPLSADLAVPVTAAPVPEPGEWAMIMAGLGVIGFAARRRRD